MSDKVTVFILITKIWFSFAVGALSLWSGVESGHAASLTLAQALALAEEYHPQLQAGEAQVEAAQAGITTARAYPNPEAGVLPGGQTYLVPGNVSGFMYSFSLRQPLELGTLRPSRIQLAERGRESSEYALAGTRLAVLSGVRWAFYQVLRKRGEIGLLTENLRVVEDLRQRIQVRVDVGEVGRLELIRADAEVAAARTAANNAQLQYVSALSQLRAAVGSTLDTNLEVEGVVDPPVNLPMLDELRREALDRYPALALARSEVHRAEARLSYETALRRPQPALRADIDRPPDTPTYRIGIELPLPLWNRREGPIAEAAAQLRQTKALAQSRELEILAAIEGAYGRYQVASQQLAAFDQGLLREAEEALRAAETAYQLGERGILEVLDAQRVLRTVRLDFLNAQFDRQAIARYGLNASDVHDVIEAAVGGKAATEIYEGERRFQAVVRYPEHFRSSATDIRGILLTGPDGEQVPLGSLARVELREGLSQIKREMAKRRIVVGINVRDRDLGGFVAELQEKVQQQVQLPAGYYYEWGGQFENMQRARRHLMIIVPITIGAIFFLLFLLFRSLRFAALIIMVLPFASIGGVAALYFSGEYLSVPASVGFIALWGIAVLNGVVLVSYIRNLREAGIDQRRAIIEGAKLRFRPVMMTATVAALGLIPFLFATGPGSEVQRPLAIVVIGGLITSTLLTLVVVPSLYRFFDDQPANGVEPPASTAVEHLRDRSFDYQPADSTSI